MEPFATVGMRFDNEKPEMADVEKAVARRRRSTRIANLGTFTGYRIGLDVGNGNIGWCVLFEAETPGRGRLLHFLTAEAIAAHNTSLLREQPRTQLPGLKDFVPVGTHKFDAREREQKGEQSFSTIRSEKRRSERLLDARQRRRLHVRIALEVAGLLPKPGEPLGGHRSIRADVLRVRLLDPEFKAHPHDLGRALSVVLRHRGWMPPVGRAGRDEDSAFGTKKTDEYRAALVAYGCETVGQFLDKCVRDAKADNRGSIRKRHRPLDWQREHEKEKPKPQSQARSYEVMQFLAPTWALIRDEARLLRSRQRLTVPVSDPDWATVEAAAEFRRSLKGTVPGPCRFLRDQFRCIRALPSFQRFRILEQVSHLRTPRNQVLDDQSFQQAVAALEQSEKISVAELGRRLRAGALRHDEDKPSRNLVGATTDIALSSAFGEAWMLLPIEQRDEWVMRFLSRKAPGADGKPSPWEQTDEEALQREAAALFGNGAMERLRKDAMPELVKGDKFADISLRAAMIQADSYMRRLDHDARMEALIAAGARAPALDLFERLPYYGQAMPDVAVPAKGFAPPERTCEEERQFGRGANPDVHVVLNRIRKVVNAIIEMMGGILPTTCIVEVARSAMSEEAANEHGAKVREREKLRNLILTAIRKVFDDLGKPMPRGPGLDKLVERWKAAVRQNWRDYDGNAISPSVLVDGATYQLDHVSPAAFGAFRENNMFVSRFNQQKGRNRPWQAAEASATFNKFRPALLAFAKFGLEQRIWTLEAALKPKPGKPRLKRDRQERIEQSLQRAKEELASLGKHETPRPDLYAALRRTLTEKIEVLVRGESAAAEESGKRSGTRPFSAGDQAALFCRFSPVMPQLRQEFAARDKANIAWSTRLALRYLRHLGADVDVARPRDSYALRCMYDIDKPRQDLRNHAVDAFLAAHFDRHVLLPAFNRLRQLSERFEELYSPRALRCVMAGDGEAFLDQFEHNLTALYAELPFIATAHRADHRWNPGDAGGGTLGAFGRENIYSFRPTLDERRTLTRIVAKHRKQPEPQKPMTRKELLTLLTDEATEQKLKDELRKEVTVRYWRREGGTRTVTSTKLQTALHVRTQPGAFVNAEAKFALVGGRKKADRRVLGIAEIADRQPDERHPLFGSQRQAFRSGDTIGQDLSALVVTGLLTDTRIIAYPLDEATREGDHKVRVAAGEEVRGIPSDVLGRRLHRLRKDPGGLEPVPYPLRGK
jgi:hypothetical protein